MGLDQTIVTSDHEDAEELARFRKVNSFHGWVEENLNDGKETNVEYIKMTIEDIDKLMEDIWNTTYGDSDALKPREGFFFGNYEVDNSFYFDLGYLYAKMLNIKRTMEEENMDHVYYWSWW